MKKDWSKIKYLLFSIAMAYVLTALGIFLIALLLYKFHWDKNRIAIGVMVIYALSCAVGGWIAGRKMKRNKYIWGLLTGVLYFVLLILISVLSPSGIHSQASRITASAFMCIGAGMLGGMLS